MRKSTKIWRLTTSGWTGRPSLKLYEHRLSFNHCPLHPSNSRFTTTDSLEQLHVKELGKVIPKTAKVFDLTRPNGSQAARSYPGFECWRSLFYSKLIVLVRSPINGSINSALAYISVVEAQPSWSDIWKPKGRLIHTYCNGNTLGAHNPSSRWSIICHRTRSHICSLVRQCCRQDKLRGTCKQKM